MTTMFGLTIEHDPLVLPGYWIFFHGECVIGIANRERREFLAKFGLAVAIPVGTTKILVDKEEYDRICALTKSTLC